MNEEGSIIQLIKVRLSKKEIDIFDLLGLYGYILFCKDLFKKNEELNQFVKEIFNIDFPHYIIKSRTLMAARINKYIFYLEMDEQRKVLEKTKSYFSKMEKNSSADITEPKIQSETQIRKRKRSKNENDKLDSWLKGL